MTDTPSSGHPGPTRRAQSFLHPRSGKQVYTASNPVAAETLRRTLTDTHGDDGFDLFIRGSEEHIKAIEEARSHREQEREELRRSHKEVFSQFEVVHDELDALAAELHALSSQGVALDANFSRFGYDAHIRTVEDDSESPSLSKVTSAQSDPAARLTAEAIPLFKRPTIRQYYHKGLIWRASDNAEVSSIELLIDLIYVGILDIIGEKASEEPTGESLLQFSIVFILSYKLWSDVTATIGYLSISDLSSRFCILLYQAFLIGFTINIQNGFDSTYTELIAFYVGERLFTAAYYICIAFTIPMVAGPFIAFAFLMATGCGLWIASIHVEYPTQLAMIWIAIAFDLFGNGMIMPFTRSSETFEKTFMAPVAKFFKFYPAINIEHKVERQNAFVTLVLGYLVLAVLFQSSAASGIHAFFGKAILGLIIVFCFSFFYFEVDSSNLHAHAIRRHAYSFFVWQQMHLLFILSFVLASGAAKKLVLAHDCADCSTESLAEGYAESSLEEIDAALRWFFCGGLGVALLCTAGISISHNHKDFAGQRMRKRKRLTLRIICSTIIITLPTAGERLNSVEMMAVTTGLIAFSLLIELWGASDVKNSFWSDRKACDYSAECKLRKSDMEALRRGEVTDIDQLMQRQHGSDTEKALIDFGT